MQRLIEREPRPDVMALRVHLQSIFPTAASRSVKTLDSDQRGSVSASLAARAMSYRLEHACMCRTRVSRKGRLPLQWKVLDQRTTILCQRRMRF